MKRLAHIVLLLLSMLCLAPGRSTAQLLPSSSEKNMYFYSSTQFLNTLKSDVQIKARIHLQEIAFEKAFYNEDYELALALSDSLILNSKRLKSTCIHSAKFYRKHAEILHILKRDPEACQAYNRALQEQNLQAQIEQDDHLRELQAAYELDRLELDRALLAARDQGKVLILAILLLITALIAAGFTYLIHRRTKRLQNQLTQQMLHSRESEAKKADFINSMCHEVRTPLNCIAGFTELLCDPEITPQLYGQYCEIIRDNRRQLRYLFDDLLEVAQLENLQEPLSRSYIGLCSLCRTQLRSFKVRSPKPGVAYVDEIPPNEIGIISNEKRLNMLLGALLSNACKFTQQGTIRISCGRTDDDQVFIAVQDTGCGIAPEHRAYVFERFTKLDTFSQGNGLGLYLCLLITRHLGGKIHIDPAYTTGTRIVVTLPRK